LNIPEILKKCWHAKTSLRELVDRIPKYELEDDNFTRKTKALRSAELEFDEAVSVVKGFHRALMDVDREQNEQVELGKRKRRYEHSKVRSRYMDMSCPKSLAGVVAQTLSSEQGDDARALCTYKADLADSHFAKAVACRGPAGA
jgi:hypothetical protein